MIGVSTMCLIFRTSNDKFGVFFPSTCIIIIVLDYCKPIDKMMSCYINKIILK
jgi:hypothetical protein